MFKLSTRPRITRRVPLVISVDGDKIDSSFTATFQIQPLSALSEEKMAEDRNQQDFLRKAVVHLDDIAGDDDMPVSFSPELLEQLLDRAEVRMALINAYAEAQTEAARGN